MATNRRVGERMQAGAADETNLASYEEFARAAAAESAPGAFLNRRAEHAWVIADLLFKKANQRVEILTGAQNPRIYADERVVESAHAFLERCATPEPFEPSLFILVENSGDWPVHPLISRVLNSCPTKLEVRRVPPEIKTTYDFHFMVVDGKHFRCKRFRDSPEAFIQFNAADTGETLHQLFEQIRLKSNIVDLGA